MNTNYFIILTRACNLKCKYCGEDASFETPPIDIAYPLNNLRNFLQRDESDVTIQFYGGEPLIRIPLMEKIIDSMDFVKHWSVQTNAIKLHKIKPRYLARISTILASIDGRKEVTDENRGKGVYDKVLENCITARKNGFNGDLVARMAISEVADIYEDVMHLATINKPRFNHIHWQIDSQWDDDPKIRWKDFNKWVDDSYNPGISKLVKWWLERMKNGEFIGLVPFIPVMNSILFNSPSILRCGAGIDSFAINPNGSISVCPISPEFRFSIVGDIWNSSPNEIRNSFVVTDPCPSCDIIQLCGGRCLFINQTKLWGEKAFTKVCKTVRHMIDELRAIKKEVLELIENGLIKKEEFAYPTFNNGCEIIP